MAVKKVTPQNFVQYLKKPWVPITLGRVDDHEVKILKFKGEYHRHQHQDHDECIFVYEGQVCIELEKGEKVTLNQGEGAFIEKGTVHKSFAKDQALVLVIQGKTIMSDFVKV
ncbi:MAG: cupin domain-containing protein [Planctomycetes bacterium]|nr:cupin domain-containing protein [Planctomycetota bacterium]